MVLAPREQCVRKGHLLIKCCDLLFCQVRPSFALLSEASREALLCCQALSIKKCGYHINYIEIHVLLIGTQLSSPAALQHELDITPLKFC